jgi:hypothetical protein
MNLKLYVTVCAVVLFLSCQKEDATAIVFDVKQEVLPNLPEVSTIDTLDTPVTNWVLGMQHPSGLLESASYTNFVSLYDNALAVILFVSQNKREQAEMVLDFYESKMQEELTLNGGFYQFRKTNGSEGERVWMGDNAWLLIAINHYNKAYTSTKYDTMANYLNTWLRSLQLENGALRGGINQDGSEIPLVTEGIITAYNAVSGFDDFHINILEYLKNERWDADNGVFLSWPENPSYAHALDVYALSAAIFEDISVDALIEADRFYTQQESTMTGEVLSGYCFDEDKDVVWLEGTAQMAVAFNSLGYDTKSHSLLKEVEKSFIQSSTIENAQGIPYVTNSGTSYGNSILWDHADIAPALSSTIWYQFAKTNFNPFQLGKKKDISKSYKFWIQEPSS